MVPNETYLDSDGYVTLQQAKRILLDYVVKSFECVAGSYAYRKRVYEKLKFFPETYMEDDTVDDPKEFWWWRGPTKGGPYYFKESLQNWISNELK